MARQRVWFSSASTLHYHLFGDCGHVEMMNKDNVVDTRVDIAKLPPGVQICDRCETKQERIDKERNFTV